MLNSSYLMQLMKMSNRHELLKRGLSWRDICISLRTSILMYKYDLFFLFLFLYRPCLGLMALALLRERMHLLVQSVCKTLTHKE